ncbi:S8 family serine peptidase [Pseudorhodoferax sp. Leaf274]|uniref:S8 family serine peptidase n=1 Tax=Pseudorhodoferax sp. Leaf274 TaxID=1736318 RepID=UPI0007025010|nr:S8 family serine peptidase [Pseudorhodoferax sp. Leaf274]KQP49564.1 hypothetical protein ASF44_02930 [Pseudorhodoferax sp. Leaf274]
MQDQDAMQAPADWGQDGGADAAASLLQRYDAATGLWNLPRTGEFWDAVALARQLGRFGAGCTIAIVDDGFDMAVPALAPHTLVPHIADPQPFAHGTAVALLILAVAPQARLRLYPTRTAAGWDAQAIAHALQAIARTDAAIVNLSLGQAHAHATLNRFGEFLAAMAPWPGMAEAEAPYWLNSCLGGLAAHGGWRSLLRAPDSPLADPVAALVRGGRTVVAATGNARGHVYDPALRPGVLAVGFQRVARGGDAGMERAALKAPTYSQSEFNDIGLPQPPGVIGSSFAAPLAAGFVALMAERATLPAYAELAWSAGLAEQLMAQLGADGSAPLPRQAQAVALLFANAVQAAPHAHGRGDGPCPECALFGTSAFVNGGLYALTWGDLDRAAALLAPAVAFAPNNPHAAANLAMVHARRAEAAGEVQARARELAEAARLMGQACALRPEHQPYRRRLEQFTHAAQDSRGWTLDP